MRETMIALMKDAETAYSKFIHETSCMPDKAKFTADYLLDNGVEVRSAKPMRVEVTTDDFWDLESARAKGCYRKHFFCPSCDIEIGHQTFDSKRKFGQGTVLHSNRFPNCCPSCGERLRMEDTE